MKYLLLFLMCLPFLNAAQLGEEEQQIKEAKDQAMIKQVMEMKESTSPKIEYYLQVVEDKNDINMKNGFYKTRNIIGISESPSKTYENLVMYVDIENFDYQNFYDYTKFDTVFTSKQKFKCETNNLENNPKECKSTFFTFTTDDSVTQNTKDILFSLGTSLLTKGLTNVVSFDKKLFAQVIVDNEDNIKSLLFQEIKKAFVSQNKSQGESIISLNTKIEDNEKINTKLHASLTSKEENVRKLTEELEKTKKKYLDLQKRYNSLKSQFSNAEKSIEKNNNLITQLNQKLLSSSGDQEVFKKQYQESQILKDKLINTNIKINEENKKLLKQLNEAKNQITELTKENQNLEKENKLVQDESSNIKSTTPNQAIKSVVENNTVLKEKILVLQKKNAQLVNEKMDLQKKLDNASGPVVEQTEELQNLREQISQKSTSEEQAIAEIGKLKKINQELKDEITILKKNVFDSK